MSPSSPASVRLDIDDTLPDALSYVRRANRLNPSGSQKVHVTAQQILQIIRELHKLQSYRTLRLYDDIHVTRLVSLATGLIPHSYPHTRGETRLFPTQ